MFRTHLAIAFAAGLILLDYISPKNGFIFMLFVCLGGILPDIDTRKSTLSKKIWPLNYLLDIFFRHRGIMHSIFPILHHLSTTYLNEGGKNPFPLAHEIHILKFPLREHGHKKP